MDRVTSTARLKSQGFSLLELMIVLAILGVLAGISTPSLRYFVLRSQADAIEQTLYRMVQTNRVAAIKQGQISVLCPLGENACGTDWNQGLMLFTDGDNNQKIDNNDTLVAVHQRTYSQFQIYWKASGGRKFLRFSPTGITREFGRFHICYTGDDPSLNRAMVINRQGRLMRYLEKDNDGVVMDRHGRQPDCG